MAQLAATSDEPASSAMEQRWNRSFSSSLHHRASSSFRSVAADSDDQMLSVFGEDNWREDDELELQQAAIESLPTFRQLRAAVLGHEVVDVAKLGDSERRVFVDGLLKTIEEDNLRLLQKLRERVQR